MGAPVASTTVPWKKKSFSAKTDEAKAIMTAATKKHANRRGTAMLLTSCDNETQSQIRGPSLCPTALVGQFAVCSPGRDACVCADRSLWPRTRCSSRRACLPRRVRSVAHHAPDAGAAGGGGHSRERRRRHGAHRTDERRRQLRRPCERAVIYGGFADVSGSARNASP